LLKGGKTMNFKPAYLATALAVVTCMASASSEAASPVIRGRFSYDGVATCQQPAVQNFHFHGEGTAVLGELDVELGPGIFVERGKRAARRCIPFAVDIAGLAADPLQLGLQQARNVLRDRPIRFGVRRE